MRTGTLLAVAASLSCVVAQSVCTASGLLQCLEVPLSTTCADYSCGCSALNYQTACYKSACPNIPLPTDVLSAYSAVCSPGAGGGGNNAGTPATTTPAAAGGTATAAVTTAGGPAAATSKAGAGMGAVVPAGGLLAAALGVLAYL